MMYNVPPGLIYYRVLWLKKNGKEVYRYYGKDEWMCDMESISSVESVAADNTDRHEGLYDLQGRRLSGEPTKGMYIKDGRKYAK